MSNCKAAVRQIRGFEKCFLMAGDDKLKASYGPEQARKNSSLQDKHFSAMINDHPQL